MNADERREHAAAVVWDSLARNGQAPRLTADCGKTAGEQLAVWGWKWDGERWTLGR